MWGGRGGGSSRREEGRAQIPRRLFAKLKILNLILEAVESHGGIFSGFVIHKSLTEQEDRLQGAIGGLCIIQVRNEKDVTDAMDMERGSGWRGWI